MCVGRVQNRKPCTYNIVFTRGVCVREHVRGANAVHVVPRASNRRPCVCVKQVPPGGCEIDLDLLELPSSNFQEERSSAAPAWFDPGGDMAAPARDVARLYYDLLDAQSVQPKAATSSRSRAVANPQEAIGSTRGIRSPLRAARADLFLFCV